MDSLLTLVAEVVEKVAESGAGFFSWGTGYQPEIPDELFEKEELKMDRPGRMRSRCFSSAFFTAVKGFRA